MKVILLQNVKNIGQAGDIKDVSDGYARNLLLPKKLAEIATESGIRNVATLKNKLAEAQQADLEKIQALADTLQGREIVIAAKEKDGKLFGSINAKAIARELKKEKLTIDEKTIRLAEPIKEIGEYDIAIELPHGIEASIHISVEGV